MSRSQPSKKSRRGGRSRRRNNRPVQEVDRTPLTVTVERPAHGGTCVAHVDNTVYFVRHAIPGEEVVAVPYAAKGSVVFAEAVKVMKPSRLRVTSAWEDASAGGVGGGELCHVHPAGQRIWKADVVRDVVRRVGGRELFHEYENLLGEVGDPSLVKSVSKYLGGRTRCEFVIDEQGQPAMYQVASTQTRPLTAFPFGSAGIKELNLFASDSRWNELWTCGDRVRVIDTADGAFVRIGQQWYNALGEAIILESVSYEVSGRHYLADPNGFWQAHQEAPQLLRDAVSQLCKEVKADYLIELYSGAGLLSEAIVDSTGIRNGVCVEGDPTASAFARNNCSELPVQQVCAPIEPELCTYLVSQIPQDKTGLVVADPPRTGLGRGVAASFATAQITDIVLISCDPASFARDAAQLRDAGYSPADMTVLDLFPGTYHMEIVVHLTRR